MSDHTIHPSPEHRVADWLAEWESIRPLLLSLVEQRIQSDPRLFYRRRYLELEIEHVDQALKGLAVLIKRLVSETTADD